MIPVRLRLRNFMSYGEHVDPLEFAGIRLACLCGDNGHGKSALLDAMTWALWGRARISERRDSSEDELIHLGKTEMEVEFAFEIDGVQYCVIRKRALKTTGKRRTSSGVLEFQVADGDGFRPLTGDTMRDTQREISKVLRLDYETFVNSAFILQGRADEFTRKNPTERKQILSALLGLGYYDDLEARAREQARGFENERRNHEDAVGKIDGELAREPEYQREVERLTVLIDELHAEVVRLGGEVTRLRVLGGELALKARVRDEALTRVERVEGRLRGLKRQVEDAQRRLRQHEDLAANGQEIRAGQLALVAAREEAAELDTRLQQLRAIEKRKTELDTAVVKARGAVEAEAKVAAAEVARLRGEVAREPALKRQEADLRRQLAELEPVSRERDERLQEIESSRAQVEMLDAANAKIKDDGTAMKERLDLLAKAGATCPVCEGRLDAAGRERLQVTFTAERNRMADDYKRNTTRTKELQAQIEAAKARVQVLDGKLRQRESLGRGHAAVEQELQAVAEARRKLAEAETRHAELAARLSAGDYARAEQSAAKRLADEIAGLGYDESRHKEVKDRLTKLGQYETMLDRLKRAEDEIPREKEAVDDLTRQEREAAAELKSERAKVAELDRELADQASVEAQLGRAQGALDGAMKRQTRASEDRGEAKQRADYCQYLKGERGREVEAQATAAREKDLYDELALAFGKKGIQAMIIESVIPEIEREANDVLARMTDGRLNVKFETQRDARSGDGTIETLDIKISDELGVRNLELYSGGEAFRVNFAIRIALSKLLARRAGARVQTLVVDEGFGTQDSFGRQRLIEAINSVAGDFEKIIVITHIDELKDAFPTRIDVVKGPEGSTITVN